MDGATDGERYARWDGLVRSMRENGFDPMNPIQIEIEVNNGKDQIMQGHHRLFAAEEVGIEMVPVAFLRPKNGDRA